MREEVEGGNINFLAPSDLILITGTILTIIIVGIYYYKKRSDIDFWYILVIIFFRDNSNLFSVF